MKTKSTVLSKDRPLGFDLGKVVGFLASAGGKTGRGKIEELEAGGRYLNGIIRKLKKESEIIDISTL